MERNNAKPDIIHTTENDSLKALFVRPIAPEEEGAWNDLMSKHHYLGYHRLTGKTFKYVALLNGQWVALISWGAAAFKSNHREKWIGWSQEQKTQRLKFIVNNQRFLILPGVRIKNLASKVLSLNMKRLPNDWQTTHGHFFLAAETFVDHSRFIGTCYRAAGWSPLGKTGGYGRKGNIYY